MGDRPAVEGWERGFRSGPPAIAATDPPVPPAAVGALLGRAEWRQVWIKDGTEVWRATMPAGERYLKIGPADGPDGTFAEYERLVWLAGRASTPPALVHAVHGGTGWLLTGAVDGVPSHDPRHRMRSVAPLVEALGQGLRRFHDELPVAQCPFAAGVDLLLERAEARVAAGGVDPSSMAATYRRHTPAELLDQLRASRPAEPADDLVVAHGDPGLPNLLVDASAGEVTGIVDLGRLGVSDRHRDLAIAARSLVQNFGAEVGYRFFDGYGLPHPDPLRLEFYVLLDELW